jgi:acyl carrier protein
MTKQAMTKQEIFNELKRVLVESFLIDEASITMEADLFSDLNFDSIDAIDLAAKIHAVTGRQLQPEQFRNVRTIGDAVNAVAKLLDS